MSDLQRGFDEIAENYRMARSIIDRMGRPSQTGFPEHLYYSQGRICISASTENFLTRISFDNTENTSLDRWAECLNVTSIGTIHVSNPHISMKEAGEGRSEFQYLPWTVFLKREYDRAIEHTQEES